MKYILPLLFVFSVFFSTESTFAQEAKSKWPSLDKSPLQFSYFPYNATYRNYYEGDDRNMEPKIRVQYSAPFKKDRNIFGELVKYGEEWRFGANEATEITFYENVEINESTLGAGIYTVFATPNANTWKVHFSSERFIAGTNGRDKSKDVAIIEVPVGKTSSTREQMAIAFKEIDDNLVHMIMEWDDTRIAVPISFNISVFPREDASPGDLVQYPNDSRFMNRFSAEEKKEKAAKVRVTYHRPQKKGRKIFGELLKYGEEWRVGANESTVMSLYRDANVGGKDVKAGNYNVYAVVHEKEWEIILNTDMPAWGVAKRNKDKDVAKFTVPVTEDAEDLEAMGIIFEEQKDKSVHMIIGWAKKRAAIPIRF